MAGEKSWSMKLCELCIKQLVVSSWERRRKFHRWDLWKKGREDPEIDIRCSVKMGRKMQLSTDYLHTTLKMGSRDVEALGKDRAEDPAGDSFPKTGAVGIQEKVKLYRAENHKSSAFWSSEMGKRNRVKGEEAEELEEDSFWEGDLGGNLTWMNVGFLLL